MEFNNFFGTPAAPCDDSSGSSGAYSTRYVGLVGRSMVQTGTHPFSEGGLSKIGTPVSGGREGRVGTTESKTQFFYQGQPNGRVTEMNRNVPRDRQNCYNNFPTMTPPNCGLSGFGGGNQQWFAHQQHLVHQQWLVHQQQLAQQRFAQQQLAQQRFAQQQFAQQQLAQQSMGLSASATEFVPRQELEQRRKDAEAEQRRKDAEAEQRRRKAAEAERRRRKAAEAEQRKAAEAERRRKAAEARRQREKERLDRLTEFYHRYADIAEEAQTVGNWTKAEKYWKMSYDLRFIANGLSCANNDLGHQVARQWAKVEWLYARWKCNPRNRGFRDEYFNERKERERLFGLRDAQLSADVGWSTPADVGGGSTPVLDIESFEQFPFLGS